MLSEMRAVQLLDAFRASVVLELERGLAFILVPVFLSLGIIVYFVIPEEPSLWALLVAATTMWLLVRSLGGRGPVFHLLGAIALMFCGMLAAQTAVSRSNNAVIHETLTGNLVGVVLAADSNRRGTPRYLIRPLKMQGLDKESLPRRLRLSAPSKTVPFEPGVLIGGLARVQPVYGPVFPGGYDFAFFARFEGLGGSGFFMGKPQRAEFDQPHAITFLERIEVAVNRLRSGIGDRIQRNLPGAPGKIATALVTGDKSAIPQDIQEALRATGLAHILAISGLHMALVALTVVWLLRALAAFHPVFPLTHPVKKWAAGAGFAFATLYLLLSGAGVATQRAWIMICVMLLAVMTDRRAITMRSVAISALLIVLIDPQSIFMPGFQMSFAAVVALVAAYQALNELKEKRFEESLSSRRSETLTLVRVPVVYLSGIAITSIVAGTATGFVAAWHFQKIAPFGLIANLLAMPIVTSMIMPAVLLSIVFIPFGLEFMPLHLVGIGIEWVVEIAFWVEEFGPAKPTGLLPQTCYALFILSILMLSLLRSRLRLLGLLPLLFFPVAFSEAEIPDILIAENGRSVAVKSGSGELQRLYPKRENFVTRSWGRAYGSGSTTYEPQVPDACNRDRCMVVLNSSLVLHVVYDPELLRSSCNRADILVAPRLRWVNCRGRKPRLILKRGDFERHGTHAVYIKNAVEQSKDHKAFGRTEIITQTAIGEPTRPWHRRVPGDAEN